MTKKTYTLEFKICIIKKLLKQTMELQKIYEKYPDNFDKNFWIWQQSERCAYLTVLNILDDNLDYITEKTLLNANKLRG